MKKNRRNKWAKWAAWGAGAAALAILYSVAVEPKLLVNRRRTLEHRASQNVAKLKVIHLSDVHLGPHFSLERLEQLVAAINKEKPDLILFTGDMIDKARLYQEAETAALLLGKLEAPLGKFAVWGNHDYGGGGVRVYPKMMQSAGFVLLKNETAQIVVNENARIDISGVDDAKFGRPEYGFLKRAPEPGRSSYHIVLAHAPDQADHIADYKPDLILSGHSHGGQVALPFIGPLYTPKGAWIYRSGSHKIQDSLLYIENGAGSTGLPVRFMAFPGFTTFTILF